MYKTGDMARCREDGTLEYLGRLDDQVKIRGYRVELGEIEAVVAEHAAVSHCVALAREDEAGKQAVGGLCDSARRASGYAERAARISETKASRVYGAGALRVSRCLSIDSEWQGGSPRVAGPGEDLVRQEFISPRNASESKLAALWTELLGVGPVSVTDNFFDLGGDSLLAARLLVRIEQLFGKQLSMTTLFQAPTIRQLAVILESRVPSASQVIPVQPAGSLPPFFCIGAGPLFRPLSPAARN